MKYLRKRRDKRKDLESTRITVVSTINPNHIEEKKEKKLVRLSNTIIARKNITSENILNPKRPQKLVLFLATSESLSESRKIVLRKIFGISGVTPL